MKYLFVLFLLLLLQFSCSPTFSQKTPKQVIIIDAGHGGKDPGNLASSKKFLNEKDINLKIALLLGSYIENRLLHVRVVYTRQDDNSLALADRVYIANTSNADYYISIHCNSATKTEIKGAETHIHNFDCKESFELADKINKQFSNRAQRNSRGTYDAADREKNLKVVKSTSMPAVLIETGFMSNPSEEKFLNTDYGRSIIASAIFRGFRDYLGKEYENTKLFKIQLTISKKKNINTSDLIKQGYTVEYQFDNKLSKYRVLIEGIYNQENADKIKQRVLKMGFKEACLISSHTI